MPLTTTAATGRSTPDDKTAIGYSVGHDLQEAVDPTTKGHTVTLTVDGADTVAFEYEMLGYSVLQDGALHRVLPEPSGRDHSLYCVKLDSVLHVPDDLDDADPDAPVTAVNDAGWSTYQIEAFRATFVRPLYKVLEDDEVTHEHERFCVWRTKLTAQNEKIPGGGFQWVDDAVAANRTKVPEVGVKTGRMTELTCKWLDVPIFDYDRLKVLCNKINTSAVTWNGVTYDAETVLLTGVDQEPRVNAFGTYNYDITFSFAVRTDGRTWNKFWKSGASGYVEISSTGLSGGDKPFETADLNDLWIFT